MEGSMKEVGKTIICMAQVSILGKMDENMTASTIWTRNTDLEFTFGQMDEDTKEIGLMESSTEKENISFQMEQLKLEYGRKENELDG
jgi:hypothetical protein